MTEPIECFFRDVGQGSCNIILLPGRRAIVIDMPASKRWAFNFLKRYVDRIEAVLLTHNDKDHCGGIQQICSHFSGPGFLGTVGFLIDRAPEDISFLNAMTYKEQKGEIEQVVRLERNECPQCVWQSAKLDADLMTLYPKFVPNIGADSSNETSAIVRFRYGDTSVIFTGDAPLCALRNVAGESDSVNCDIITIPHHGADSQPVGNSLSDIYASTVIADYAVVSVGTSNTNNHPSPTAIKTVTEAGSTVLCTQITDQCADDLECLRPGVCRPSKYCRSMEKSDFTQSGNSRNVACAATVETILFPNKIEIRCLEEHQQEVDKLSEHADGHPLCRG